MRDYFKSEDSLEIMKVQNEGVVDPEKLTYSDSELDEIAEG